MWTGTNTLLLLACCLWAAEGQNDNGNARANGGVRANGNGGAENKKSIWEDPIQFGTKANDLCTMIVTGQGEFTRLRVSCQGGESPYWCEYMGKPQACRAYNNNPRHYFTQIMWDMRKLQNACEAPKAIKPQMCKRAPEESQMVFSASSTSEAAAPQKPERPQEKQPTQARPETPKAPTTKQASAKPSAAKPEQARPEQAKQARPEQARPDQARPDQARPDQARPEQARPEQARPEQAKPEQARPAKAEQTKPDQAKPSATRPVQSRPEQARPAPARPAAAKPDQAKVDQEPGKPAAPKPGKPQVKTTALRKMLTPKSSTPKPTKAPVKTNAKKIAQDYCWRSMQGVCTYVISWFKN